MKSFYGGLVGKKSLRYQPVIGADKRRFASNILHGTAMQLGGLRGARRLAKAVASTLGPGGRNVVIDPFSKANFN